jgi:hypothetical protein
MRTLAAAEGSAYECDWERASGLDFHFFAVRHTGFVRTRRDPRETIWERGRSAFAFLVQEWGFEEPERTDNGLLYHRPGLHISVEYWAWKNEAGFTTTVHGVDLDGRQRRALLGCLYVACGLGPLQAVPEDAGTQHTINKRIAQHANALRRVMPYLHDPAAGNLLSRCQGRQLPAD